MDNDWAGDPDGLLALAHHLLSPANVVVGVSSSFLFEKLLHGDLVAGSTASAGTALARELVERFFPDVTHLPVVSGAESAFGSVREPTPASDLIRDAALAQDELPLYVVCGGPLTNVAQAIAQDPSIVGRFELVWIGGSASAQEGEEQSEQDDEREGEQEYEYNRDTDPEAAAFVLAQAGLVVHQFPLTTYRQCAFSIAELEVDLADSGALGEWLYERFTSPPDWVRLGGVWPLGDSPPVLITALTTESSEARTHTTPEGVTVHEYTRVDWRLVVGDLLARLTLHERQQERA